ncbi:MFS general substrate transporter [Pleurostoma richardsiae]|uniref:MFS general substrate transporter n=1 Tax=Pleurostoma richardsiae TaxID=41990 RepID=A0AA38S2U1_9PEZI|nr:MFS general substrate transporter [Pleurostoma richardsiae]
MDLTKADDQARSLVEEHPNDGIVDVIADRVEHRTDEEKALVRKIDIYLMPIVWIMYLFSYADRTNIGNAKVAGMYDDLRLSSSDYSMALVVFFISYVFFEIPSNMILARTRPSLYIPGIMILWGIVTCSMAAAKTYHQLLAIRFLLGVLEAGFGPGIMLILSCWYRKGEQAKRFAVFYSAAVLSGAFGGIVAGAITGSLDGAHGIRGWRWLFIVEGASTIGVAIIAVLILPDFPATWKRFSPRERQLAVARLEADNVVTDSEHALKITHMTAMRMSLTDWRTWMLATAYLLLAAASTMSYFYPTLLAGLGYGGQMAQYMVVPIYGVSFVVTLAAGVLNDKIPTYRGAVIAALLGVSCICAIVVCAVYNYTARYVLLVFLASGNLAANAQSLAFASSTCAPMPQEVRGVSLAFINALASLAGIYGAYIFPSKDAPKYIPGFTTVSCCLAGAVAIYASAQVLFRKYPWKNTPALHS